MIGEPVREIGRLLLHRRPQPAAFQDVDVLGGECPVIKLFDAPALVPGHAYRRLQVRGEVPRRRIIELARVAIAQPDPSGVETQEFGDQPERAFQRLLHVGRTVEGLGNGVEDSQFPDMRLLGACRPLRARCLTLAVHDGYSWLQRTRRALSPPPVRGQAGPWTEGQVTISRGGDLFSLPRSA